MVKMKKYDEQYNQYIQILKEELVPAMGCTEPIAIAYIASYAREVLGCEPQRVVIEVSGNVLKNVKSVIVPNTEQMKGIQAAVAAGIVCGKADHKLEVLAEVNVEDKKAQEFSCGMIASFVNDGSAYYGTSSEYFLSEDCYSTVNYTGNIKTDSAYLGTISPMKNTRCYYAGNIKGFSSVMTPFNTLSGLTTDCYYDNMVLGIDTNSGGTGQRTAAMQKQSTYKNWDFDKVWRIEEGKGYPTLNTETPSLRPGWSQNSRFSWNPWLSTTMR